LLGGRRYLMQLSSKPPGEQSEVRSTLISAEVF
jgi:hypothetical protein